MNNDVYEMDATDENFPEIIEHSFSSPVLVDFWSESCAACKTFSPLLSSLADQYQGQFILVRVNTDENPQFVTQFGIQGLPSARMLKEGQIVAEINEALSEADLRSFLDVHCQPIEDKRLAQARSLFEKGDELQAVGLLNELIEDKPDTVPAYLMLAYDQVKQSDLLAARITLESVPKALQKNSEVALLKGRLSFADSLMGAPTRDVLQQRIVDDANDSDAHYYLAGYAVISNEYEKALDILLTVVSTDPEFREQARKTMITIFDMLGEDPLAIEYRKKLSQMLH